MSKFTEYGGILTSYQSQNYLEVQPGCVPPKCIYTVRYRLSTSFDDIEISKHEQILTPLMEFQVDGNFTFIKPVKVIIFPFESKANWRFDTSAVKVYMKHDGKQTELKCLRQTGNNDIDNGEYKELNAWFSIEACGQICVYTTHFSKILCTFSNSTATEDIHSMRCLLVGKMFAKENDKVGLLIEIFLQFVRNCDNTKEFWTVSFSTILLNLCCTKLIYD